jgi:hypothetical protein
MTKGLLIKSGGNIKAMNPKFGITREQTLARLESFRSLTHDFSPIENCVFVRARTLLEQLMDDNQTCDCFPGYDGCIRVCFYKEGQCFECDFYPDRCEFKHLNAADDVIEECVIVGWRQYLDLPRRMAAAYFRERSGPPRVEGKFLLSSK